MELLCSYKPMDKVNLLIVLKYLVFIFFIWIYHACNDVVPFGKSLENIYKQEKILSIKFNRLLAKHDIKRELEHTRLREKLPERTAYKSERNVYDNLSAYSGVKSKSSNNIDLYMKNYKRRYGKKKGLFKLDCYCENKVFTKFNNICDIGKKMKYDEKRSKCFFLKKYGIGIIIFALIPALGLIFPILFGPGGEIPGIFGLCPGGNGSGTHSDGAGGHKTNGPEAQCDKIWLYKNKDTIETFGLVSYIFSFIMITIVLLVVFYIFIKTIKYEKLKAGKGKMNMKEYCRFCKDIF